MPPASLKGSPRVEVFRRLPHGSFALSTSYDRSYRCRHRLANLGLHREDVGQIAVVTFGPDMITGLGLDQLGGYPDSVSGFAEAAFEHVANAEFAPDLPNLDHAAFVSETGVA